MMKEFLLNFLKYKPKRSVLRKFLIILSILIIYSSFAIGHYGIKNGILVSFLTWSLFVFCTPIADAGFLLDFPIRLFTKIRMLHSEIFVWVFAFLLNLFSLTFFPDIYEKTFLLRIFKTILLNPIPYWIIILLSLLGTLLSIYFGDELLDVFNHKERKKYHKHRNKYWFLVAIFIIVSIIILYYYLLNSLGIKF